MAFAASSEAAVRNVLLLQAFDRGNLTVDSFTGYFRFEVDQRTAGPVTWTQFVVNPSGFDEIPEKAIVDYLQSAFVDRPEPDLVITIGGPAAAFARKYRRQIFPESPLLFAAVDERFLQGAPLADNETAVAVRNDYAAAVNDILQLFPQTSTVFMVTGSGPLTRFWHRELQVDFQRFENRLTFVWSDELSFEQTLQRVSMLPPHSAIFYLTFSADRQGGAYPEDRVLAAIHDAANAPLFGAQSPMLGHGILGGRLMPIDQLGRVTADVALRILNGESAGEIRVPVQTAGAPVFDERELQRWGIDENRLPPGSTIRFRGPNLWRDYRRQVVAVLGALVVQSLLILALLYQRRARRRAELDSRRHLTLAADANRRATVSALTGSMAHELSQPLNSILHNAQAGEMLLAANRATPEVLQEILADIRTADDRATQIIERHRMMLRNRELERRPIDIHGVVRDSVALLGHDLNARQIQIELDLPPDACPIAGDPVLLQQVLVNLLVNAMDAMDATPAERRRLRVQNQVTAGRVEIAVRDAGTGLPEQLDGKLFEPFVTTKTNGTGIGLTIAHTIVEAHRGSLRARNNPDGGATFTVTLPCDERAVTA
jgi:signal transduction histidine kinase